jgi:hypothetical protein
MTLEPTLWQALVAHGVTPAHLEMLLQLLCVERNGSWTWHIHSGRLQQCDLRLSFPSRPGEIQRVQQLTHLVDEEEKPP